jgi:hypothetical protein
MLPAIQDKFMSAVLGEVRTSFLTFTSSRALVKEMHRKNLATHHPHLADIKSHRACFCCFLRMPEKVLSCGHAMCNPCIKIFGRRSKTSRNSYQLEHCILCGVDQQDSIFHFVPPTAGIRVLSVDGGGVRGIGPLMFLQHLDSRLSSLCCSFRDHFDLVCGTSAGTCFQ